MGKEISCNCNAGPTKRKWRGKTNNSLWKVNTCLLHQEVCFKYWPNENKTLEFGKFSVETISEDAWDKDIVKRTFKLTNTKQVR